MRDVRTCSRGCTCWPAISIVGLVVASRRRDRAATWQRRPRRRARSLGRRGHPRRHRRSSRSISCSRSSTRSSSRQGRSLSIPATDRLVQLFPFDFWQETSIVVGVVIIAIAARRGVGRWEAGSRGAAAVCEPERLRSPDLGHERGGRRRRAPATTAVAAAAGLLSVEAARDAVLAAAEPVGTERVPVGDALGRVIAETADRSGLASAVAEFGDGRLRDHRRRHGRQRATRSPIRLEVIGDIRAGCATGRRRPPRNGRPHRNGSAAPRWRRCGRPGRSDHAARRDGCGRTAWPRRDGPGPGRVPRPRGSRDRRLRPGGAAATSPRAQSSFDRAVASRRPLSPCWPEPVSREILVHRRPRIGVLATGDEIRAPGEELGPAGIPDANGPGLRALVTVLRRRADRPRHRPGRPRRRPRSPATRARRRCRRDRRVGRRFRRALRRREDRARDDRPHRSLAGRGPARQAVHVRHGPASRRRTAGPALRPAGEPGVVGRDVRAVREARDPQLAGRHDLLRPLSIAPSSASRSRRATAGARSCGSRPSATTMAGPVRDAVGPCPSSTSQAGRGATSSRRSPRPMPSRSSPRTKTPLAAGSEVALWWLDRA